MCPVLPKGMLLGATPLLTHVTNCAPAGPPVTDFSIVP
jgi:hypothetical protein